MSDVGLPLDLLTKSLGVRTCDEPQQRPAAWHRETNRSWKCRAEEPDQTLPSPFPPTEIQRWTPDPRPRILKTWFRRWETHAIACHTSVTRGEPDGREISEWTCLYCPRRHLIGSSTMLNASVVLKCTAVTVVCVIC